MAYVATGQVSRADVAAHYDDLDRFYREIWGEHVHHGLWESGRTTPEEATRRLIAVVADRARIKSGDAVCDIGCGYGATARILAAEYGATVTGLTISAAQHRYACEVDGGGEGPAYLLRDWMENGLEPGRFDAAIAIESSEHMADLATFYAEAGRVLRPGGRLVVCAWLERERPTRWERRTLIDPICREGRMRGMDLAREHRRLAVAAGLIPSAFEDVSRQAKRTWSICMRRVALGLIRDRSYRRFLMGEGGPNRVFALTLMRIWLAYELGTMRYGILTFCKPTE